MPWYLWWFDALVSWAVAGCVLLAIGGLATLLVWQPAHKIRVVELTLAGLAILPILGMLPGYPRWSPAKLVATELAALPDETHVAAATDDETATPIAATPGDEKTVASSPATVSAPGVNYRRLLVLAYGAAVMALVVRSAVGRWLVSRILAEAQPAGARSRAALRSLAGAASNRVRLVESPRVAQPCALVWYRPTIVLPRGYGLRTDWQQLSWALAHEWSHIERGHLLAWQISGLLGWLYFYQPLFWHLRRRLYVWQDYVADAQAAHAGQAAEDYAEFLTRAAWSTARPALAGGLGMGGRRSDLHRRILMLLDTRSPLARRPSRRWNLLATLFAGLALAITATLVEVPLARAVAQDFREDAPAGTFRLQRKAAQNVATQAGKKPAVLSYNDGTAEGKRSLGGSGEMIAFKLPAADAKVGGIRIHASRYGYPQPPKENAMIYFLNADRSEIVATKTVPYSRFKRGEPQWVDVKFPKPIELPEEFWVCLDFHAEQTKGVYVSVDDSTDGSHSRVGLPDAESRAANVGGDWMIEVVLAR